jgi:type VI secretion system secreted protein VgrG
MSASQANRLLQIESPALAKDIVLVQDFTATEAISGLFSFQVNVRHLKATPTEKAPIALPSLVGKPVAVSIELADGNRRYFHGIVNRFGQSGNDLRFDYYYLEAVPWMWLLTQTSDCRIFQDMTVPEIVKKIFKDQGYQDFRDALTGSYTKVDYCVQYRETDFNFVSRLLEQEGIFYFFEHEKSKHTLVLADAADAHKPCPGQPKARFAPEAGFGEREDTVTGWQMEEALRPGKYTLRDHHFEMPDKTLEVNQPSSVNVGGNSKLEIYDYPGEYAERFNKPEKRLGDVQPEGQKMVKLRMGEEEMPHQVISGHSYCRAFTTGSRFDLVSPPQGVTGGPYVLTSLYHSAAQDSGAVSGSGSDGSYRNTFSCILHPVIFRPARSTPKPVVHGPQTAVVVGIKGEEIDTDKFGRVKVQFHWDREGKKDQNSSCWLRVATPWAGKRWGMIHIPRIGQEVVVSFLEGDPDQPIITGSVYNADQMPPYELPKEKTKSTLKSRSTLNGTPANFNEIRFEDKKGSEQIFINAEKDMDLRVENDERHWVGQDRHLIIKRDQKDLVERDKHLHVKRDQPEAIDGKWSLTVGGDRHSKIGQVDTTESGQEIHLKAGMKIIIEAGVQISLVVGGNFIDISPAGVAIVGTMVMINSGGAPGTGTPAQPASPKDPDVADDGSKTGKLN